MKVYISADIEGITGVTSWDEADIAHPEYAACRARMAAEVRAACRGALDAGATDVLVKDAHATGRNLRPGDLPAPTRLIRGWSGHPLCMVQDLDATFAAVVFVGWHASAGDGGNPLAHTLSSRQLQEVRLDGVRASEFRLHALAAASLGVPVVCVTGDAWICREVDRMNPAIATVPVKSGAGESTTSRHPDEVDAAIRAAVAEALRDPDACRIEAPTNPVVEVVYKRQTAAYRTSWYPGAELVDPCTVRFAADGMFDVMRFLQFAT